MNHLINMTGKRFGKLTVIERCGSDTQKQAVWKCSCDCGNTRIVRGSVLRKGLAKSCGCISKKLMSRETHGMSQTRIYHIYESIKRRCLNKDYFDYPSYGGRGITICPEWLGEHGFENFAKWAYSTGYDENADYGKCTLDRIDVNGNYEPSNCRWANAKTQANNRRNNRYITFNGETKTLSEWANISNIPKDTLRFRINSGWSVKDALYKPVRKRK